MSSLKGILFLFFYLTLEFLITIFLLGSIIFILPFFGLWKMIQERFFRMDSKLSMMLLTIVVIMNSSCQSREIIEQPLTSTIVEYVDCKDVNGEKILKNTIKGLSVTIENQKHIIEKYQIDLEKERKKAEEAQKALGFIEYIENLFYFLIFCVVLYIVVKVTKKVGIL